MAAIAALALSCLAPAHPANIPAAKVKVSRDGSYEVRVKFDLLAFVLDSSPADITDAPMNALLDGPPAELQARLTSSAPRFTATTHLLTDKGGAEIDSIVFPSAGDVALWVRDNPKLRLPVMLTAVLKGHLPDGARTLALRFPETLGTVVLTAEMPYQEPFSEPVEPGSTSHGVTIPTPAEIDAAARSMGITPAPAAPKPAPAPKPTLLNPFRGADVRAEIDGDPFADASASATFGFAPVEPGVTAPDDRESTPVQTYSPVQRPAWYALFPSYVRMGFVHILPLGLDHILFVLGLFLLSRRTRDLLKQVTAFTVAHSLTLALSLYGVFRLPSGIVEPVIALSIAFVAIENIWCREMKVWRPYVVFLFGLVHGLGFASALQEVGLQRGDFLTGLLGFNAGVELGQLTVVAGALLLVGWFRSNARYRSWIVVPASVCIAAIAVIWTVQRVL